MGSEIGVLGEFIKVQGGFAYKSKDFTDTGSCKVLKIKNVRFGVVDYSDAAYISEELANQTCNWSTSEGDVLISMTGSGPNAPQSLVGRVARIWKGEEKAWINQRVGKVILKEENPIHLDYIYYLLSMKSSQEFLVANSSGSANQANISGKTIESLPCPRLNFEESCRLATILRSFDEKIILNRQINQTLEQMAQALFKSWFVDFDPVIDNALDAGNPIPDALAERAALRQTVRASDDFQPLPDDVRQLFPSEFEDSELGWIPKGWGSVSVINLIQLIGGGTPKTSIEEYWNGDIPWFSVVDAPIESNVFVIDTEKHVTDLGVKNSSTKILRKGTTIISARGTVGKCAMVASPMAMNQSCYGIQGIDGVTDEFTYYLIRYSVSQLQQKSHGSVFSTITRDTFKSLGFAFCGASLTDKFSEYIAPMFEKILSNNLENNELEKLRDTLLPKLISGELRLDSPEVEQAKGLVEAV